MMIMSFGTFLFTICHNIWSFLSDRIHKEYEYIFSSGERHWVRGSARGEYYVKDIVDSVTQVHRDKYKYDPYVIEDKLYTWLRIPLIVKVEHYRTFVEGVKTLHKAETCKIIEKDGQLFVSGRLGAGPLHFNTFVFAKLACIEQLVTIKAYLDYCKFNVNFSVDAETARNRRFQGLCIEEFSGVNVCITGFGCLSWLLSKFITLMMKLNHGTIRNLVEFWIERYVSRFFPGNQLPAECENINASISENYGALDNADESLQETSMSRIQQFIPENARNVWYSNVPLLEINTVNRSHNDSESDADDIQVEFKFLKNDVNLEDVERLTSPDMATCCVFFKSETDFLKKSATKDTEKHLPFKHSKDFLFELQKLCTSNERTRSCNERLLKNFFKDYPHFVSLTYNMCEERKLEANGSNEDIDSSAEAKVCESQSEITVETNDVIGVNVASTVGSQNEQNGEFGDSNVLSETVDQSNVLKRVKESNTISNLSKSQKSDLAELLNFLSDMKMEELRKETDHFEINLEAILKEADAKSYGKQNKNNHTTELNTPFQSETANSKTFYMSKIVKNFFEQNSTDQMLCELIQSNLGADNKYINESDELLLGEHDINISASPNAKYLSSVKKDHLPDSVKEFLEESYASLDLRKLDMSSKDSNYCTAMISDIGTQSTHNTMNDEVEGGEFNSDGSDETCDSSFSSYTDVTKIHPDFMEYASDIDSLNKNKTDSINRQLTEASLYSSDENIQASGNSSPKTSNIKMLDICQGSPYKVNEKQIVEIEKLETKVPEANQTATLEEQIVSINETKLHTNVGKIELSDAELALMSVLDSDGYGKLMDSEETKSNVVINVEDDIPKDLSTLYDDAVKQIKDYANITENST